MGVKFLMKNEVLHKIKEKSNEYKGKFGKESKLLDNTLIKDLVKQLLLEKYEPESEIECPGKDNKKFRMKYFAHLESLDGHVSERAYNDSSILSGDYSELTKWDQGEFLLIHLYFLLNLYLRFKNHKVEAPPPEETEEFLVNEIWITVNAYRVRKGYKAVYDKKIEEIQKTGELINNFLKVAKDSLESSMKNGEEICFPCGYKEHAIYLVLYKLDEKRVTLRIDNLGPDEAGYHPRTEEKYPRARPHVLITVPIDTLDKNSEINKYFCNLCEVACQSGNDKNLVATIYNKGEPKYNLPDASENDENAFELRPIQQVANCVVENFFTGINQRSKLYQKPESILNWLHTEADMFAVTSHEAITSLIEKNILASSFRFQCPSKDLIGESTQERNRSGGNELSDSIRIKSKHLNKLEEYFKGHSSGVAFVSGHPVIGKTQLIESYRANNAEKYKEIIYYENKSKLEEIVEKYRGDNCNLLFLFQISFPPSEEVWKDFKSAILSLKKLKNFNAIVEEDKLAADSFYKNRDLPCSTLEISLEIPQMEERREYLKELLNQKEKFNKLGKEGKNKIVGYLVENNLLYPSVIKSVLNDLAPSANNFTIDRILQNCESRGKEDFKYLLSKIANEEKAKIFYIVWFLAQIGQESCLEYIFSNTAENKESKTLAHALKDIADILSLCTNSAKDAIGNSGSWITYVKLNTLQKGWIKESIYDGEQYREYKIPRLRSLFGSLNNIFSKSTGDGGVINSNNIQCFRELLDEVGNEEDFWQGVCCENNATGRNAENIKITENFILLYSETYKYYSTAGDKKSLKELELKLGTALNNVIENNTTRFESFLRLHKNTLIESYAINSNNVKYFESLLNKIGDIAGFWKNCSEGGIKDIAFLYTKIHQYHLENKKEKEFKVEMGISQNGIDDFEKLLASLRKLLSYDPKTNSINADNITYFELLFDSVYDNNDFWEKNSHNDKIQCIKDFIFLYEKISKYYFDGHKTKEFKSILEKMLNKISENTIIFNEEIEQTDEYLSILQRSIILPASDKTVDVCTSYHHLDKVLSIMEGKNQFLKGLLGECDTKKTKEKVEKYFRENKQHIILRYLFFKRQEVMLLINFYNQLLTDQHYKNSYQKQREEDDRCKKYKNCIYNLLYDANQLIVELEKMYKVIAEVNEIDVTADKREDLLCNKNKSEAKKEIYMGLFKLKFNQTAINELMFLYNESLKKDSLNAFYKASPYFYLLGKRCIENFFIFPRETLSSEPYKYLLKLIEFKKNLFCNDDIRENNELDVLLAYSETLVLMGNIDRAREEIMKIESRLSKFKTNNSNNSSVMDRQSRKAKKQSTKEEVKKNNEQIDEWNSYLHFIKGLLYSRNSKCSKEDIGQELDAYIKFCDNTNKGDCSSNVKYYRAKKLKEHLNSKIKEEIDSKIFNGGTDFYCNFWKANSPQSSELQCGRKRSLST